MELIIFISIYSATLLPILLHHFIFAVLKTRLSSWRNLMRFLFRNVKDKSYKSELKSISNVKKCNLCNFHSIVSSSNTKKKDSRINARLLKQVRYENVFHSYLKRCWSGKLNRPKERILYGFRNSRSIGNWLHFTRGMKIS